MSRTTSVLVPVDGSPLSERALRFALREFPEADLTAYHVVDLFEPTAAAGEPAGAYEPMIGSDAWHGAVRQATDRIFGDVDRIAADYGRTVATDSDVGDPAGLVVDYVREEHVDHVVLGAHGWTDAERALFGSVAEAVVRRAPVPVTVVR